MRIHTLLAASALVVGSGALSLVSLSAALADPGEHGFHHGEDFLRGVSLSDAQRDQVKQIEQTGWTQARAGFEQMRSVHEQIMARLLSPGSVSEADLAPLVQQEQSLRAQMDEQRLQRVLQVRLVLTPQQLAEAAAKHQQIESLHAQEHQLMEPSGQE